MTKLDKLSGEFYLQDTLSAAKQLIGRLLVTEGAAVRITETEAYIGDIDKACHCYGGRKTDRTEVMFRKGGCAYVYMIYGMYYCLNVVTEKEGRGCAVLIRGAEPVFGLDVLSQNRYGKNYGELSKYQIKNFADGPGKLCMALGIDKSFNGESLLSDRLYIADDGAEAYNIKIGKRINIDYAEEAKDFMWRFYV